MKAFLPDNELARLEALYRYKVLDTDTDQQAFDDLTTLAAQICQTPIALISLIDSDRQWFKSTVGLTASETHRDLAFCAHAILQNELMIVPDAKLDQRFASNPFVTADPHIRFYAGAPLVTPDGYHLGTLCVVDRMPRQLQVEQADALRALSRQVINLLELQRNLVVLQEREQRLRLIINAEPECVKIIDADGRLLEMNPAGLAMIEVDNLSDAVGQQVDALVVPEHRADFRALNQRVCQGESGVLEFDIVGCQGTRRHLESHAVPLQIGPDGTLAQLAITRDISDRKRAEEERDRFFNLSLDLICTAKLDGYFTQLNPAWEKTLGHSLEELQRTPFIDFVHPDDRAATVAEFQKLANGSITPHFENRYRCRDGSYKWFSWTAVSVIELGLVYAIARDITSYKQVSEALEQSERRLSTLMDNLPGYVYQVANDPDYTPEFVSVGVVRVTGYRQDEYLIDRIINHGQEIHPDDRDLVWKQVQRAVKLRHPYECEYRIITKSGDEKWVWERGRGIFAESGDLLRLEGFVTDISDRKRIENEHNHAEEALRQQAKRERLVNKIAQQVRQSLDLNEILNTTVWQVQQFLQADRVLTYRIDPNGVGTVTHEAVAPDCASILRKPLPEDVFPVEWHQLYQHGRIRAIADIEHDQMSACLVETLQQLGVKSKLVVPILHNGALWGLLIAHHCRTSRKWQPDEIELLKSLSTQVAIAIQQSQLYQQVQLELLERKRAEQKNQEQAALLDVATDAIFVTDLDNKILYWNKGSERLYGWTFAETINQSAVALLYRQAPPNNQEIYQAIFLTGEWQGELQHISKDGKDLIVESRWTLIHRPDGKPKAVLVVNTDITQKKLLERQFLRSQRMESIGTLASGIAHDLNNILTPILMSVQLLRMKLSNEQSEQWLDILESSTKRGGDLIKQVLSFARGMDGEKGVLQTRHLIDEIKKIAEETFPKSIRIYTNVPWELWTICGDATHLHQVLMNLCVNARDAMPDGGTLSITAKNVVLDETEAQLHLDAKAGAYVEIVVEDTGTGIPSQMVDRIFEPFFTTKELNKGTGLGLSTVLGIVKSHEGFITVSSQIGQGTKFQVFLPAVDTEEPAIASETDLLMGHGEWILVVDDEKPILEIAKNLLGTYGYTVLTACNGTEAIALYAQHQQDIRLVFVDLMMPEMDGETTIRALQKMKPDVKIVTSSGLLQGTELSDVERANIHSFLPKPYTSKDLLQTVHEVLKK